MRSRTVFGPSIDWSVSSAVLITDGVAAIVGWAAFTGPRQRACGACGDTGVGTRSANADCVQRRRTEPQCAWAGCQLKTAGFGFGAGPRAREYCVLGGSWTRRRRVVVFFGLPISSPCVGAKPIAAGSVCADSEAVVAATRRICAALRREARIAINRALTAAAQLKR